ncbi:MAG: hypothetical protein DI629_01430 [Mesorhizobium amorphae]|nr:MAG: hypothetical protein DI629_01430 [Mesorhizobium amorphae]
MRAGFVTLAAAFVAFPAAAYENARFGYALELPSGFGPVTEADNGDGGRSLADRGDAELLVWGAGLLASSFARDVAARIKADEAEGWDVSYRRDTRRWASWSGSKDGRIFYNRAIPLCDGAIGVFRLEYDRAAKTGYDATVTELVRNFRSADCR